jgi:hypothetical protein
VLRLDLNPTDHIIAIPHSAARVWQATDDRGRKYLLLIATISTSHPDAMEELQNLFHQVSNPPCPVQIAKLA